MNEDFKAFAKANKVHLYQVAEVLGIRPSEFSVQYMRHELTPTEKNSLMLIVEAIKGGRHDDQRVPNET